jgi:hypothetical protein
MNPSQRRDTSNALLAKLRVPVVPSLPLIESEEETSVRDRGEILGRLIALWAVTGAAHLPDVKFFRSYIESNRLEDWLSDREQRFLLASSHAEAERVHFGWQLEPLYFLAWSAGLIPSIALPIQQSNVSAILALFPLESSPTHMRLESAISLRARSELVDWADLLYRAHWAVRDSQLRGRESPAGLVPGAVMEWHKAANWVTRYEDQDDWDEVGTDT